MVEPRDILLWVGAESYDTPQDFADEAISQGTSQRLSVKPKGLVPMRSRVYFMHPRAILVLTDPLGQGRGQEALFEALVDELHALDIETVERFWSRWEKEIPVEHRHLTSWVWKLKEMGIPGVLKALGEYETRFDAGIFGVTMFTNYDIVTNAQAGSAVEIDEEWEDEAIRVIHVKRKRD